MTFRKDFDFERQRAMEYAAEYLCIASSYITNDEGILLAGRIEPGEAYRLVEKIVNEYRTSVLKGCDE